MRQAGLTFRVFQAPSCFFVKLFQREAVDFCVVANVHRKFFRVNKKAGNAARVLKFLSESLELFKNFRAADFGCSRAEFDDDGGKGVPAFSESDERGAKYVRMRVENRFAGFGEKRSRGGFDAFRFATEEPKFAFVVEVADISHAMPDGAVGGIFDFGGGGRACVVEISVRGCRSANADFSGCSGGEGGNAVEGRDGRIGNRNDADAVLRENFSGSPPP